MIPAIGYILVVAAISVTVIAAPAAACRILGWACRPFLRRQEKAPDVRDLGDGPPVFDVERCDLSDWEMRRLVLIRNGLPLEAPEPARKAGKR